MTKLDYDAAMKRRFETMISATDRIPQPDLRHRRAMSITALVMNTLSKHLVDENRREAHEALFQLFWEMGFDAVTDDDRAKAGLAPRGELGWTDEELRLLEAARIYAMARPITMMMPTERARGESPSEENTK